MPIEHNFQTEETVRKKLARPLQRLDDLQKVTALKEDNESTNAVDQADSEAKIEKKLKKEGIDKHNIIENKGRKK